MSATKAAPKPDRPGFRHGLRCFFKGFSLLFGTPGALPLALVPIAVALVLTLALWTVAVFFVPSLVDWWVDGEPWWLPVAKVLATVTCFILAVLIGVALSQPASGPALDALVRRVEKRIGEDQHPESPFIVEVARSAGSAAIGMGAGITSFVGLLLLGLIPGAIVVTVPLKILSAAFCVAWDVCDYPLSARGVPLGARLSFVFRHKGAIFGFSLGLLGCAFIPCGFLLFLPLGIAGATALVRDLVAWDDRLTS